MLCLRGKHTDLSSTLLFCRERPSGARNAAVASTCGRTPTAVGAANPVSDSAAGKAGFVWDGARAREGRKGAH